MAEETPAVNAVVACDLDGTLISINSYKLWVVMTCAAAALTLRMDFLRRVFRGFSRKRSGSMTRWEVKRDLIAAADRSPLLKWVSRVVVQACLRAFIRKSVLQVVQEVKTSRGARTFLVTAAWGVYCEGLAADLGFDGTLATQSHAAIENLAEAKVDALAAIASQPLHLTVLTDHYDDIPLARIASHVYLVHPSKTSEDRFVAAGIPFTKMEG